MERFKINKDDIPASIEKIFDNAMGSPIIFKETPTSDGMSANTWGKVKDATDYIYVKFADGTACKIQMTSL